MSKIITIGETVFDIIFKNHQPVRATPGGAMLNTAVSLGRLHLPISLITEFGDDLVGRMIASFLAANHVGRDFISPYKDGKTALAIAFLDEDNKADYDFYRIFPSARLQGPLPEFQKNDLVLFGSFFALDRAVRKSLLAIVRRAKAAGAIVLYDPNFRKAHLHELEELLPLIQENIRLADIVKGSDDDFWMICGTSDPEGIFLFVRELGCSNLALTQGPGDVVLKTGSITRVYPVSKIEVVSTIGAGDNFNAGLLFALHRLNVSRAGLVKLEASAWDEVISRAIAFAQNVCQSYENFISADFAQNILDIAF
jgi:fructokinase